MLEQHDANLAFHLALLQMHPNREFGLLVTDLRGRVSAAPAGQWRSHRRVKQSSVEHFGMVDAVRRQDAAGFGALIRAHILQTA